MRVGARDGSPGGCFGGRRRRDYRAEEALIGSRSLRRRTVLARFSAVPMPYIVGGVSILPLPVVGQVAQNFLVRRLLGRSGPRERGVEKVIGSGRGAYPGNRAWSLRRLAERVLRTPARFTVSGRRITLTTGGASAHWRMLARRLANPARPLRIAGPHSHADPSPGPLRPARHRGASSYRTSPICAG